LRIKGINKKLRAKIRPDSGEINIPAISAMEVRKLYELWAGSHLMRVKNIGISEPTRPDNSMLRIIARNTTTPTLIFHDQISVTTRARKPRIIPLRSSFNVSRRITLSESLL
jgi:hypothetical protein